MSNTLDKLITLQDAKITVHITKAFREEMNNHPEIIKEYERLKKITEDLDKLSQ